MRSSSLHKKKKHIYRDHNIKRKFGSMKKMSRTHNYLIILLPLLLVFTFSLIENYGRVDDFLAMSQVSWYLILSATAQTILRIVIAFLFAVVSAFLLAIFVTMNGTVEKIFLPIFDVLESVPILAFFPIIITYFLNMGELNGAAIFVIYITMLWSMLFTIVGGIKLIPEDIKDAAIVYGIKGFKYIRHVLFPSVIPEVITGTILAFAQAWNIVIVAEVMHVYIKGGDSSTDLLGLGSLLVDSTTSGDKHLFFITLFTMVAIIAFVNICIWQNLLNYAEKYRFE